ncbi:MAG: aminoglycoside phosphotransferase family protein [Gemmatimonadaceae bacterium]
MRTKDDPLIVRFNERVRAWRVTVENSFETESSLIAFGRQSERAVVLKVVKRPGDEWNSGRMLEAFDGRGMVRVYEHVEGAMLLERLEPATSLSTLVVDGRDEEATDVVADVISRIKLTDAPPSTPTARELARAFDWYRPTGDAQIPLQLLDKAERLYNDLAQSQKQTRLLHGDLQHYNILRDAKSGWVAIDPKGIAGELEYEIGASLRNPYETPAIFSAPEVIERRIRQFEGALKLDADRILGWGFSQAVLSAIWGVEDGYSVPPESVPIVLAQSMSAMLGF